MRKKDIDRVDLEILNILQREGDITNVELSNRVGLTPPPTLKRVKALVSKKVLVGYKAEINLSYFGVKCAAKCIVEVLQNDDSIHYLIAEDTVQNLYVCKSSNPFKDVDVFVFDVYLPSYANLAEHIDHILSKVKGIVGFQMFKNPVKKKPSVYILNEDNL
jgi:DNA-binding Lrp family transcriptional regulator